MRAIKFRFWHIEGGYMITSKRGCLTAMGHIMNVATSPGFSDCDNQPHPDMYVPMQFTGLFDKNGQEIFEGDILKTYPILASDKIGDQSFNVPVKWGVTGFYSNGMLGEYQASISEVIGNIHENPELLKTE